MDLLVYLVLDSYHFREPELAIRLEGSCDPQLKLEGTCRYRRRLTSFLRFEFLDLHGTTSSCI